MKAIHVYLQGGLGNQCFIYAAARALALRAQASVSINLDYFAEDYVYKRKLALNQFYCPLEISNLNNKLVRMLKLLRYKVLRDRVARIGNLCIDRRPFYFSELPTEWRGTLTIDGYWQSEKYFYDARGQIVEDFRLRDDVWIGSDPVADQIRGVDNSVFIHLRSYKEVPGKRDGRCAQQMLVYYRNAIAYVFEHIDNPAFFVFSDDIGFAKTLLSPLFAVSGFRSSINYVETLHRDTAATGNYKCPMGQIRDFTLMRLCKHGIVADSSFSWWAGWLGEQERIARGEQPIRLHVNRRVMNDDFWPERWVAVDG